jgi:anionic cell wall polymer biosynthesis LytR-Cps2A-Psr (LCP) family protein
MRGKKNKKRDKSYILLAVIIIVIIGTGFFLFFNFRTDQISDDIRQGKQIAVAFLFHDEGTLQFTEILYYNPETHKGAILDIPGNLGTIIESLERIDRIDLLYKEGRPGAYVDKLEELTGVEIPYTVEMSIGDVEKCVDLMEGLEMFIANPVEIIEEDEVVLLPSGSMLLDGGKIATFVRYSEFPGESEIEKISRRQKFMQSFLGRLGERAEELTDPGVLRYLADFTSSDLDKRSLSALVLEIRKLDVDRIVFQRVLGVNRVVDAQTLLFPHYDGKLLKETVGQTLDSLASTEIASGEELRISLEILNGTNRNGLASRTAQLFKSFGYEVVHVGNAESFDYESTLVLDRSGNINKAQKVANIITCKHVNTVLEETPEEADSEPDMIVDVTIILGKDFDGRYCKN